MTAITSRRVAVRAAAAAVAFGLLALLSIGPMIAPASAHSKLVSSSPSEGAVRDAPPSQVEFTFDEELLQGTTVISINDDQGNSIATTPVEPIGKTISAPWPNGAAAGSYQVAYRIVSADGHPVTGAVTFSVAGAQPAATLEPAAAPASARTPESPPPTANVGVGRTVIIGIFVLVAVAGAVVIIATRRRRER